MMNYKLQIDCLLLLLLSGCSVPQVITDTRRVSADSARHATATRIITRDTLIYGEPTAEYPRPLVRISERTLIVRDTVFRICTDTVFRTETRVVKERYVPPFYKWCTISLATLATLATLYFSIRFLLRYFRTRRPP